MVQNGKVKIYLADIRPLFDETMQKKALAQLDEVRRQKALSCRQTIFSDFTGDDWQLAD